jgi:hypothetical protein
MAASVAAVAVLVSVTGLRREESVDSSGGFLPQVSAPALAPVANPVSRRRGELLAVAMTPEQAEQRAELDELLLRHSGAMAEQGVGGPLRYARVAAHARPAVLRADSAGTEVR